ncbi:MAG: TlpA family protein disulfide reductase [Candidatus Omnitrophica bacterium]|nr:TlpA family protein disulfide reductase [Candidatus Omnitrophota bacterium]MBU1995755.1 TlpA family protein disulfide reductase [Candidatus Omnitrophota bacterium]
MKMFIKASLSLIILLAMLYPASASSQLRWGQVSLVGNPAPDFELSTLDGSLKSFDKFRDGNNAIIFFWTTWCPHCRSQLMALSNKKAEFERTNIKIILVNEGETETVVKAFLNNNSVEFDVFFDDEGSVGRKYQVVGIPTFYFIDSAGTVKATEHFIPDDYGSFFARGSKYKK